MEPTGMMKHIEKQMLMMCTDADTVPPFPRSDSDYEEKKSKRFPYICKFNSN